jgi:ADP-heptose:LPS heptosyltransferase
MPYRLLWSYDHVLPLGMHKVVNGDTLGDYFQRAYGVPYEPHGFARDEETEEKVFTRLKYRHGLDPAEGPIIFVQAASRPLKTYPHIEELVEALVARGHRVALIGSRRDSAMLDQPGKLANLCGLSVWSTIQLLRHAALVVTPDSVFLHVAGALGLPSLSLFGPTAAFWSSAYPKATVVSFSATCRFLPCWVPDESQPPCGERRAPPCMREIPVDFALDVIERKLAGEALGPLVEVPRIPSLQVIANHRR